MHDAMRRTGPTPSQQLTDVASGLHELMRLIESEVRLELLGLLCGGPKDVGELARATAFEMSAVSKGLRGLRDAQLVCCRVLRTRREYAIAERVRLTTGADTVDLSAEAQRGGRLTIGIPRGVVHSSGPRSGIVLAGREPVPL